MANRVSAIRDASEVTQWKYIHTSQNHADDASRGLTVQRLINGPEFLREPVSEWSKDIVDTNISDDDPELKKELLTNVSSVEITKNATHRLIHYFSDWKLKTAVAWMLKVKKFLFETSCQRKQLMMTLNDCSVLEQKLQQVKASFGGQCLSTDYLSEVRKDSVIHKLSPILEGC